MFTAVFGKRHSDKIWAYNGAKREHHGRTNVAAYQVAMAEVEFQELYPPKVFGMAAVNTDSERANLICHKIVILDMTLMLRKLKWLVT